jgi:GTPase SAR1 family protein
MAAIAVIRKFTSDGFIAHTGSHAIYCIVAATLRKMYQNTYGSDLKVNMAVALTGMYVTITNHGSMKTFVARRIRQPDVLVLLIGGPKKMYSAAVAKIAAKCMLVHTFWEKGSGGVNSAQLIYCAPGRPFIMQRATNEQLEEVVDKLLDGDVQRSALTAVIRILTGKEGFIAQTCNSIVKCAVSAKVLEEYQNTYGSDLKVDVAVVLDGKYANVPGSMEILTITSIRQPDVPVLLVSGSKQMYCAAVAKIDKKCRLVYTIWETDEYTSTGEIVYCAPGRPPIVRSVTNEQLEEVVGKLLNGEETQGAASSIQSDEKSNDSGSSTKIIDENIVCASTDDVQAHQVSCTHATTLLGEDTTRAASSAQTLIGVIRRFTGEGVVVETKDATLRYKISQDLRWRLYEGCWRIYGTDLQLNMAIALTSSTDAHRNDEGVRQYEATSIHETRIPVLLVSGSNHLYRLAKKVVESTDVHTIWEQHTGLDYAQLVYHSPRKFPIIRRANEEQLEGVLAELLNGDKKEEQIEEDVQRSSEEEESVYTLLLIGEVSSGKSSLLNSLAGGYVANASLQRETMRPSSYRLGVTEKADATVQRISKALESTHLRNDDERARIADLAEEDLCKLEVVADQSRPIPFDLGAGSIDVIDFAGINDADDREGRLFLPIQKNISRADLIIFVTAADRAFQNSSEVESFKRLQALVAAEVDAGHYVDLIVVVNKFDDHDDPDLLKMAERIPERIGLSKEKILKVSSHKMLLSNVKMNGRKLYIPNFARREIAGILKTANVRITQELRTELAKSGTIGHTNIEYQLELDDLLADQDSCTRVTTLMGLGTTRRASSSLADEPSDEEEEKEASSSKSSGSQLDEKMVKGLRGENSTGVRADDVQAHPVSCTRATNLRGDWDGLIRYLGHFGAHLPEMTSRTMKGTVKKRLDKWADGCIKFCDTYLTHDTYMMPLHTELAEICNNKVHVKSEDITEVMVELVDKLWLKAQQCYAGCTILEMVLQWLLSAGDAQRGVIAKILVLLGDAGKTLASAYTRIIILCESLAAGIECPDGLIKTVLSDPLLYASVNQFSVLWFDCSANAASSTFPRCQPQPLRAGEVCYQNWVVQTLLNHLPANWARLLKLAIMPAIYVRSLIASERMFFKIPAVLGTASDFSLMLKHYLTVFLESLQSGRNSVILGPRLFMLKENTADYMKQRSLFLEGYMDD